MSNSQEIVKLFLKLIIWWYDNEKPVDNIVVLKYYIQKDEFRYL